MLSVKQIIIVIQNLKLINCDKRMLDEMKRSKSATLGEKLAKYLIVKPILLSKYKLGLGTKKVE